MWMSCDHHVNVMWPSCDFSRVGWPSRRLWRKLSQQTINDRVVSWTLSPYDFFLALCRGGAWVRGYLLPIFFFIPSAVVLGVPVESTVIIRSFRGCVWSPFFLLPFPSFPPSLLPFLTPPFPLQADYADVKVFKTEKKGWGLLAIKNIRSYVALCFSGWVKVNSTS